MRKNKFREAFIVPLKIFYFQDQKKSTDEKHLIHICSESNFQRNLSPVVQSYYGQLKIVFSIFDLRDVCVSYSFKARGKNSITQPE